jgi:predicted nucleic acid-binding protein
MAGYFLDTSAFVKRYHAEVGTTQLDGLFARPGETLVISKLGLVEAISAFALKVRTGEIASPDFAAARKRLLGDVAQRTVLVGRVLVRHFNRAGELIARHALTRRLRTLDALQLAIALDYQQEKRIQCFVCADQILCDVASLEGLACINLLSAPTA